MTQGHGPPLLMLQGGDSDADGTDALAAHLIDHYTVLSYDRRGLSRSSVDDPSAPVDLSTHCDDAARLLAAVTDEPALVFGTSIGALLGLDLVSRTRSRFGSSFAMSHRLLNCWRSPNVARPGGSRRTSKRPTGTTGSPKL